MGTVICRVINGLFTPVEVSVHPERIAIYCSEVYDYRTARVTVKIGWAVNFNG